MGCNCASREQIEKLHALYGEKINPTTGLTLKFKIIKVINTIGVGCILLLLLPFIFGFVLYKFLSNDKIIKLRKLLGISKDNKEIERVIAENILKNANM